MIHAFFTDASILIAALLRTRLDHTVVERALLQQLVIHAENQPRPRLTAAGRGFRVALLHRLRFYSFPEVPTGDTDD